MKADEEARRPLEIPAAFEIRFPGAKQPRRIGLKDMRQLKSEILASRPTALSRLDARVKLLLTLAYTFAVISVPFDRPLMLLPLAVLLAAALGAGEVPLGHAMKRLALGLPFVAFVALFPLLFETELLTLRFGEAEAVITTGAVRSASVLARFALAFGAAVVLTSTTPFARIVEAMGRLGFPSPFTAAVALIWRYLSVLAGEGARMAAARAARTVKRPSIRLSWASSGAIVGGLFVRAMLRSERVHSAMEARGFKGRFPAPVPNPLSAADWAVLLIFGGLLAISAALSIAGVV